MDEIHKNTKEAARKIVNIIETLELHNDHGAIMLLSIAASLSSRVFAKSQAKPLADLFIEMFKMSKSIETGGGMEQFVRGMMARAKEENDDRA